MLSYCLLCISCFRFNCMASWSDIPGRNGPSKELEGSPMPFWGRLESCSWWQLIQSGISVKNRAIGPVAPVRICLAGISWSMKSRRSLKSISHSSLLSLDGGPGTVGTHGPVLGTKSHISASILYTILGTILGTLQKDALCHPRYRSIYRYDIQFRRTLPPTISKFYFDIGCNIEQKWVCNIRYTDIKGKNLWCRLQYRFNIGIYRCTVSLIVHCIQYDEPGAAGRTGHAPAQPTGPASWSSTGLDGLYSCVTVFTPFPAVRHSANSAQNALQWSGPGMYGP